MRTFWVLAFACAACGFQSGSVPVDARTNADAHANADATLRDAPPLAPVITNKAYTHDYVAMELVYPLEVGAGSNRFLLVTAQTGESLCSMPGATVDSITFDGMALSPIAEMVGVPNCAVDTRSEVWGLAAPPTGTYDVIVTLSGDEPSFHSAAIAFVGVDPSTPVRSTATGSGSATSSSVTIDSAPGDLVVSFAGQGTLIDGAGVSSTTLFFDNDSAATSLDNTAASTLVGAATTTSIWDYGIDDSDNWQTVVVSLRPPG